MTAPRKTVELKSKRIPLRKLLHGKEIREAAKALEDFRLNFTEQEILHGGRITVKMDAYGEATAVVKRLETDKEYEERLEKARLAHEAKIEREKKAAIAKAEKARRDEETRRERVAEQIRAMAKANGFSSEELVDILDK